MLESAWLLLVPPLLLRLLPFRPAHHQGFHALGDLLLPLLVAVLGTALQFELTSLRLGGLWAASDFAEYCALALGVEEGGLATSMSLNRSRLSAWLPGALSARLGILDSFAVATWISVTVTNLGLWIWGRALHSRLAGAAAVVLASTLPMAAQLSRTLSLYPEVTAALVLASGLSCLALRHRHPVLRLAAGAGIGLVLLIDGRGLLWALALSPLGLLACLGLPWADWRRPPWRRIALGSLLFALPIQLSWFAGPRAYSAQTVSLEEQSDVAQRYRDIGIQVTSDDLPERPGFVYGRSPVSELPATLRYLHAESRAAAPHDRARARLHGSPNRERLVDPWIPLGVGALLVAGLSLWRRPQLLLALACTGFPFLFALKRTVDLHYSQERMVGQAQLALALLLGVAYAALALGGLPGRSSPERPQLQRSWPPPWPARWRQRRWPAWSGSLWSALALLIPLALVQNWVPSHLSPWASWRADPVSPEGFQALACLTGEAAGGEPCAGGSATFRRRCVQRIREDLDVAEPRFTGGLFEPLDGG